MFFSKKKPSSADGAHKTQKLSDILSASNLPEFSPEAIRDLLFYVAWLLAPIQNAPLLLTFVGLFAILSSMHRFREHGVITLRSIFPGEMRWIPFVILFGLFASSSVMWSISSSYTILSSLYGVWVPLSIVIALSHFIDNFKHFRHMLAFFLYYLVALFLLAEGGAGFGRPLEGVRYDWPVHYFTRQAAATWVAIVFPVFFTLLWHQDVQFRKFSWIGMGLSILLAVFIANIGLWICLFLSSVAMLLAFIWVGKKRYKFSAFMHTHGHAFKKALVFLAFVSSMIMLGFVRNKGQEFVMSFNVLHIMPSLTLEKMVRGIGFGEPVFQEFFKNVYKLSELPWLFGFFFQAGIVGLVLLVWIWLQLLIVFLEDLISDRADQQWVGMLGVGVMVSVLATSFLSHIELGTITMPAALAVGLLYSLKRFLKF